MGNIELLRMALLKKGIFLSHKCLFPYFPIGLTNAFAKGVKINGGSVFEDCPVTKINLNTAKAVKSVSVGNHQVRIFKYTETLQSLNLTIQ